MMVSGALTGIKNSDGGIPKRLTQVSDGVIPCGLRRVPLLVPKVAHHPRPTLRTLSHVPGQRFLPSAIGLWLLLLCAMIFVSGGGRRG